MKASAGVRYPNAHGPVVGLVDDLLHFVRHVHRDCAAFGQVSVDHAVAVLAARPLRAGVRVGEPGMATYFANCDSELFLGGNDETTTKWYSTILGNQTIWTTLTTENKGMNGSYSIQQSAQKREPLTVDELGRLDNAMCVYILRGLKPFHSRKLGYIP